MNTLDYFSQPDEPEQPDYCTLHIVLAPEKFGVSKMLVRLSGCSRAVLEDAFQNPPKSLQIERRRLSRLVHYLKSCHCLFLISFDSPLYISYNNAADRACLLHPPLWRELSFDRY